MIKAEQVPDAAAFALNDAQKDPDASPWDLIAAALNAWPGMEVFSIMSDGEESIVLPIPQEDGNERE